MSPGGDAARKGEQGRDRKDGSIPSLLLPRDLFIYIDQETWGL